MIFYFFFSSRRRHTRCSRDWSSDVCSSDLFRLGRAPFLESRHRETVRGRGSRATWRRRRRVSVLPLPVQTRPAGGGSRSGERRGGEEGRSRGAPDHLKKKKKKSDNDGELCE